MSTLMYRFLLGRPKVLREARGRKLERLRPGDRWGVVNYLARRGSRPDGCGLRCPVAVLLEEQPSETAAIGRGAVRWTALNAANAVTVCERELATSIGPP